MRHGRYYPEFAWRLAEILIEQNKSPEALSEYLQVVLKLRDYQPAYRFLRGRAEMVQGNLDLPAKPIGDPAGDWSNSLACLRKHGVIVTSCFKFDLALAGIAYGRGDDAKAIRLAEAAHERIPREFTPLITLGEIYYELGDLDKSEKAWAEAIERPFHLTRRHSRLDSHATGTTRRVARLRTHLRSTFRSARTREEANPQRREPRLARIRNSSGWRDVQGKLSIRFRRLASCTSTIPLLCFH